MSEDELTRPWDVFAAGWFHLLPLFILLAFLIAGYSPDWCAVMAIFSILVINWIRQGLAWLMPENFEMPRELMNLKGVFSAMVDGTQNSLIVGSAAAAGCTASPAPGTYVYEVGAESDAFRPVQASLWMFDHWELDGIDGA